LTTIPVGIAIAGPSSLYSSGVFTFGAFVFFATR
jgi:hypothetical protein